MEKRMKNSSRLSSIPIVFEEKFPKSYINDVEGWGIGKEALHSRLEDGSYKLLTLDIDFGENCSLACPHCFRKSEALESDDPPLSFDEILDIIKEAKDLGLQSVKFLGAGEPLENPEILPFLEELKRLDIIPAIFTKGHVFGSDLLTETYYGKLGIKTSQDLIEELKNLNASILFGFNSFHNYVQENFVGIKNSILKNFVQLRDNALYNLYKFGFNDYHPAKATKLALIAAPIKPENIHEILGIYIWGRRRNMYVLSCPTTYSGLGKKEYERQKKMKFSEYIEELKKLYVDIYIWNIKYGLISVDQFKEEGVSLYPGCHPCNQVAGGFYITLKGKVIRCPGRDSEDFIEYSDIRKRKSLKDVWEKSQNYNLAAQTDKFNYHCIARDGFFFSDPGSFYSDIYERVLRKVNG